MTKDEIKRNAPSGAMFYAIKDGETLYLKAIGGWWYLWGVDNWNSFNSLNVAAIRDDLRRL